MNAPFFYIASYEASQQQVMLDETNSKHAIQVLRLKKGDAILLADGCGHLINGIIADEHRKACTVQIESVEFSARPDDPVILAVSLLKNTNRFEWLLEKVTELGVSRIVPLICERTEKETMRIDRLQAVLVSAMLQSQQCWLPVLDSPQPFSYLAHLKETASNCCIAYCGAVSKIPLAAWKILPGASLVCIGPEGDFTADEQAEAAANGFTTVSLGTTRLRTETAAMVASALLCQRATLH